MATRAFRRALITSVFALCLLGGCKLFQQSVTAKGVYFGYYTPSSGTVPVPVYGAILPGQYAYFGGTNGAIYVLPDTIKDESFTDDVTAFSALGQTFGNGQTVRHFTFNGQANSNNGTVDYITGVLSGDTGGGSVSLNYKTLSSNVPSLASLAGTYSGYYWGSSTAISITISNTGAFNFNDGFGCSGLGNISVSSDYNLLQVNATISGNSVCPGTVNGLGFTDTQDRDNLFQNQSGTYIYLGMSNSNTGFIAELRKS